MKHRVEFNTTGYYLGGNGMWETLDNFLEVEADSTQEAISLAKDWWTNHVCIDSENDPESFAWRAAEVKYDSDGNLLKYNWKFDIRAYGTITITAGGKF